MFNGYSMPNFETPKDFRENNQKGKILEINLDGKGITHFESIPKTVQRLSFRNNCVSSLAELGSAAPFVEWLDLSGNKLISIEGVEDCLQLESLLLSSNYLHTCSLEGVCALPRLRLLDLSNNCISAPSARLYELPSLQYLFLNANELSEWEVGSSTNQLREIYLNGNQIKTLQIKGSFDSLEIVSVKDNNLINMGDLYKLHHAKKINLDHNKINNVDPEINHCRNLQQLSLAGNAIKALPNLSISSLTRLNLSENELISLDFLEGLENLENLNVSSNYISSIPIFPQTIPIEHIDISHNRVKSLENIEQFAKPQFCSIQKRTQIDRKKGVRNFLLFIFGMLKNLIIVTKSRNL